LGCHVCKIAKDFSLVNVYLLDKFSHSCEYVFVGWQGENEMIEIGYPLLVAFAAIGIVLYIGYRWSIR
jgi:hypothetical protein